MKSFTFPYQFLENCLISNLSRKGEGIQQTFVLCPVSPTKIKLFSPNYGLQRHPKPFRLKYFRISSENSANTTWQGTITTMSAFKQFNSWDLSKELVFQDSISHRSTCNFFPTPSFSLAIYYSLCSVCFSQLDLRTGEGNGSNTLGFCMDCSCPKSAFSSSW